MSTRFCLWLVAVIVVFLSSRLFYKLYHDISSSTNVMSLLAVEFEVFGKVQGVFFRKYTNEKALRKGASLRLYIFDEILLKWQSAIKINPLLQLRVKGLGEEYKVRWIEICYLTNLYCLEMGVWGERWRESLLQSPPWRPGFRKLAVPRLELTGQSSVTRGRSVSTPLILLRSSDETFSPLHWWISDL